MDAFLWQKKYFENFIDFAYSIPILRRADGGYDFSKVQQAYQMAVDELYTLADQGQFPVTINITLRFLKNSNSWLSLAKQSDESTQTCVIECVTYREQGEELARFAEKIGPKWAALGGLPHWGKNMQVVPGVYEDAYRKLSERGDLERFNAVRERMDPNDMFLNDFLARLLTGKVEVADRTLSRPVFYEEGAADDDHEPMTAIASRTFPLSPAIAGDEDRRRRRRRRHGRAAMRQNRTRCFRIVRSGASRTGPNFVCTVIECAIPSLAHPTCKGLSRADEPSFAMNDNLKQEIRMNKDKNKNQNVKIRSGIKAGPIT